MNAKNVIASAATIVQPTGVPFIIEKSIPLSAHKTETIAEQSVTLLKVLNRRIAESAGKIISAEIRSEPTRFIASTIITAVTQAIAKLYALVETPEDAAKFSSKVMAKIVVEHDVKNNCNGRKYYANDNIYK